MNVLVCQVISQDAKLKYEIKTDMFTKICVIGKNIGHIDIGPYPNNSK